MLISRVAGSVIHIKIQFECFVISRWNWALSAEHFEHPFSITNDFHLSGNWKIEFWVDKFLNGSSTIVVYFISTPESSPFSLFVILFFVFCFLNLQSKYWRCVHWSTANCIHCLLFTIHCPQSIVRTSGSA